MSTDPIDRVAAMLADIEAGPDELAAVLHVQGEAIPDVPLGALARPTWRLVGMGSSRFAGLDAAARLRSSGRDAYAELASASWPSPGGRDTLVVAISASGSTPEVLAAVDRHHGSSFVLALTARPDSPLAASADAVVPLGAAHREQAGIATLTYRATVAALATLTAEGDPGATRASLTAAPGVLRTLLAGSAGWLGGAADALHGGRMVHVLGDGSRIGGAEQAALVLREAPRVPAVAFDTGDWLHVGLYTLLPGDPVLLFTGSGADAEAIDTIRRRGGRLVAVGDEVAGAEVSIILPAPSTTDATVRALVESAVADLLAAELWRRTGAVTVGEEPARPG